MIERALQESTMFNMGRGPDAQVADLEQLARRYWDTWREALQRTMPGGESAASSASGGPGMSGMHDGAAPWREAMRWWSPDAASQHPAMDAFKQFQATAAPWLERIAQLATQFAGRDASPQAIAGAWREALGANPLGQMFGAMRGAGAEDWAAWLQRLQSGVNGAEGGCDAFSLPTFGLMREHQERWQKSARAFSDYRQSQQAFESLLMQASSEAFGIFERKLGDRDPATPIETPRELFDLWIDAAEEAYAEVALSPAFRKAYADMVAGQMRLRQAVQREIEQVCRALDLPTRTELDGAHRKIADLERALRRLRDRLDALDVLDAAQDRPAAASREPPRRRAGPTVVSGAPAAQEATPTARSEAPAPGRVAKKGARGPAAGKNATTAAKKPGSTRKQAAPKEGLKPESAKRAVKRPASKTATGAGTRTSTGSSGRIAAVAEPPRRGATAKRAAKAAPPARNARAASAVRARAAREPARTPSRVGGLPNQGSVPPIPQAPAPLQDQRGKPRKGKR
ncbi:hypothetical protein CNR27_11740 [Luteimonas chenhongjianii]|uniref:Poly(3-hydroxyalkanoate) polymerase subunit PhaE n=1 Tax=Luteimonas chenhongjianii TaxID=2006110 RepID=A0A290XFW5_9GAMM|nr:poly(R)-hydroxyalkanoic acid synthase subunit PhaE [Luteimonas chenhongjianii]ATD68017.1 hypothetical protein CNR27_11740 [Luteimonas chenhongjianii]